MTATTKVQTVMQSCTVLPCNTARHMVLPRLVPRQRPQTQQTSSCALQVLLDYLPGEEEEPQDDFVDFVDFLEDSDPSAGPADDSQMDTTTGNESASSASARTWRTWSPASDTDMEAECEAPSLARPSLHWASLLPTEHT